MHAYVHMYARINTHTRARTHILQKKLLKIERRDKKFGNTCFFFFFTKNVYMYKIMIANLTFPLHFSSFSLFFLFLFKEKEKLCVCLIHLTTFNTLYTYHPTNILYIIFFHIYKININSHTCL